jgi:hypothetical protein
LRDYQSYLDVDFNTGQRKYSQESETTNLLIASAPSIYSRSFILTDFSWLAQIDFTFLALTNLTNKGYLYRPLSNGQITIFVQKFEVIFKFTNANAGIGNLMMH